MTVAYMPQAQHPALVQRAQTDHSYLGWQRDRLLATGFRGTLSLTSPGKGTGVSWLGFNQPSVGAMPPTSWLQIGMMNDGRPYLEYQAPGKQRTIEFAPPAGNKIGVQVVRVGNQWQTFLNGKLWRTVPLPYFPQMYAGTELLDGSDAQMGVGNLNVLVGKKWQPFRHAQVVKR